MDLISKKEHINLMLDLLRKEHNEAYVNLKKITTKSNLVNKHLFENKNLSPKTFLKEYNNSLTEISTMIEIIRKFNMDSEMATLSNEEFMPANPEGRTVECANNIVEPVPLFKFPEPRYELYHPGYRGTCVISSMSDSEESAFFILDKSSTNIEFTNSLLVMNAYENARLEKMPDPGMVFGIILENHLFRAVRSSMDNEDDEIVTVYFLDIGETHAIPKNQRHDIYSLTPYQRAMPAQALKCKLEYLNGEKCEMADEYLKDHLYVDYDFELLSIQDGMLMVKLFERTGEIKTVSTNPFHDMSNGIIDPPTNNTKHVTFDISKETLSEEQLEMLYEDTPSTTNAMKAVLGYIPQDDKRICRFYDPKTQGCFKGSRCRLEHVPLIADGWTKDQAATKIKIRAELKVPDIGMEIHLVPTHISSVEQFWAHIVQPAYAIEKNQPNLVDMLKRMNAIENSVKFKKFKQDPIPQELVIARYTDGQWYRARILDKTDNIFQVLYVDYGNIELVRIEDLRQWEECYEYLPFQAILCRVSNIAKVEESNLDGIIQMNKTILNKCIVAKIINNTSELIVRIFDNEGYDIGEGMVVVGYAKIRENIILPSTYLPG